MQLHTAIGETVPCKFLVIKPTSPQACSVVGCIQAFRCPALTSMDLTLLLVMQIEG